MLSRCSSQPRTPLDDPSGFRRALGRWFDHHARSLPWRAGDSGPSASRRPAYSVVVSEFMLQQTQVASVIPYYQRWMTAFPDWRSLADASEASVLKAWEGLGYYARARNLHRLARAVVAAPDGFPSDPAAMQKLPGIGPYTAGAVASLAFDQPVPLADGNVFRVFARLFNIREDMRSKPPRDRVWKLVGELIPRKRPGRFNEALMELGALVCVPGTPGCDACPVRHFCSAPDPQNLPILSRPVVTRLQITYAWIQRNGKVWLLNPHEPGRWKGFHRLPEWDDVNMKKSDPSIGVHSLAFSITRFRIEATLQPGEWKRTSVAQRACRLGAWHRLETLSDLALPAPVRRMATLALRSR